MAVSGDKGSVLVAVRSIAVGYLSSVGKGKLYRARLGPECRLGGKTPLMASPGHFLAREARQELPCGKAMQSSSLPSTAPELDPASRCSQRVQQKHVLLNLPGSKGKVFMERAEITSSSEFILYDRAYLEATGL